MSKSTGITQRRSLRSRATSSASASESVPWRPKPFMKRAARWLVTRPEAILLLEPGLGKTAITLAALKALRAAGAVKRTLVVAPLRVCGQVWTHAEGGEMSKWSDFADLEESFIHGGLARREAAIERDADLYVVNHEGVLWLAGCSGCGHAAHDAPCKARLPSGERCGCDEREPPPIERLLAKGVDCLVIDELSKYKHTQTRRFKLMKPYLDRFRRRIGLTGSPAANGLLGLFGQAFVIDLGRALGSRITHYRFRHFMPTGFGGYKWVPKSKDTERLIYESMKDLAIAMRAEDNLEGLPKLVETDLWVDLPAKLRKVYDDLERDFLAQVGDRTIVASSAAVASVKCRQVASGGIYVDQQSRAVRHLHNAKTEALLELVDELQGRPLLVGYEFRHDLERIKRAIPKVVVLGSGTSPEESARIAARWNRGEIEVMAGHPMSMGHGLNLQGAGNQVCWYSPTWDFELYDQLNRRIRRQGNRAGTVVVTRIAARKTVDAIILRALGAKGRGQAALMEALRAYRRERSPA